MAIAPNYNALQADEIRRIYEQSELQLFQIIAKALIRDPDVPEWATAKLALIAANLRQMQAVTGKLNRQVPAELQKVIELAYLAGNESALSDLRAVLEQFENDPEGLPDEIQMQLFPDGFPENKINVETTMATFTGVNTEAVAALAGATTRQLTALHVPIVRAADDIYRSIVTEAAGAALTGSKARLEVSQEILDRFADKGISVFTNSRGANYEIASYAESATRTVIGQASLSGHIDQMKSFGFDLVQVSDHAGECDLCRPWEGKVLSISGDSSAYPALSEAISAGLFHTNCGHRCNTYFEGLTEPLGNTEDPEGWAERKEQRYLERGVRKWKKRQTVAMTPAAIEKADAKVMEWESRIQTFTDETGQRRKRTREQIKRAR